MPFGSAYSCGIRATQSCKIQALALCGRSGNTALLCGLNAASQNAFLCTQEQEHDESWDDTFLCTQEEHDEAWDDAWPVMHQGTLTTDALPRNHQGRDILLNSILHGRQGSSQTLLQRSGGHVAQSTFKSCNTNLCNVRALGKQCHSGQPETMRPQCRIQQKVGFGVWLLRAFPRGFLLRIGVANQRLPRTMHLGARRA